MENISQAKNCIEKLLSLTEKIRTILLVSVLTGEYMKQENELENYPYEPFLLTVDCPLFETSKGDTVIVNLEKVHPRHNDLVLIDLNGQKEIARAERTGALLRLFPQQFIQRDILDDVVIGVIVKVQKQI